MSTVYLIPSPIDEEALDCLPPYLLPHIRNCTVIFAENERTARRFLKKLDKSVQIDAFEWHTISKDNTEHERIFLQKIKSGNDIAIISEAGCPGIADPGQALVAIAHRSRCEIKPLVGPISPMLALMASGMNGQHFEFVGYLPIESAARNKAIRDLEAESKRKNSTKIFIETPYRNNQLLAALLMTCRPDTLLCVGCNMTGSGEKIITRSIEEWKSMKTDLDKMPAVFLIHSGNHSY